MKRLGDPSQTVRAARGMAGSDRRGAAMATMRDLIGTCPLLRFLFCSFLRWTCDLVPKISAAKSGKNKQKKTHDADLLSCQLVANMALGTSTDAEPLANMPKWNTNSCF